MKKILLTLVVLFIALMPLLADTPPPPPPGPSGGTGGAPIGGGAPIAEGMTFLMLMAAGYGVKKYKQNSYKEK